MLRYISIALFVILAAIDTKADVFAFQIEGVAGDNIEFALFRIWLPPDLPPSRLIVLTWGANQCSFPIADDHGWQEFASSLHCGLLTCFFVPRGFDARWDLADRGSGRALLQGLRTFAETIGNSQLANARMFLIGNSQGGQFAYHFAALAPERTLGFVSLKGGYHDASLAPAAAQIPGLFVIGQLDKTFRIANIHETFARGHALGAPWCLAISPDSHHEPELCAPLVADFLRALTNTPSPKRASSGIIIDNKRTNQVASNPNLNTSWFPSQEFGKQWEIFQTTGLSATPPMLSFESKMPSQLAIAHPSTFQLPPVMSKGQSPLFSFQIEPTNPKRWDGIKVLSRNYLSDVLQNESSSEPTSFSFRFRSVNLPLGQFSGEVPVRFTLHGKSVLGGLNVGISVRIVGDVVASPLSIYLGAVNPDKKITAKVTISSKAGKPVQFLSCTKSDEVGVTIPSKPANPLSLSFSFKFGKQDSNELNSAAGVIILHLKTDQEYALRIPYIGTVVEQQ